MITNVNISGSRSGTLVLMVQYRYRKYHTRYRVGRLAEQFLPTSLSMPNNNGFQYRYEKYRAHKHLQLQY